jgi:hypothetical protein
MELALRVSLAIDEGPCETTRDPKTRPKGEGNAGNPNADIIGQVNADRDRLAEQAQAEGPVRADRAFTTNNQSPASRPRDPSDDRQHDQGRDRRA